MVNTEDRHSSTPARARAGDLHRKHETKNPRGGSAPSSILEDADARAQEVNAWLEEAQQLPLGNVWETDSAVGGGKRMETPLFAGAFNYFDFQGFLTFLRTMAWTQPDQVQVMFHAHHDSVVDATHARPVL